MSNCNCRSDIEAKLLARFIESTPNATDHGVSLQGYAFVITDRLGVKTLPYMPIKATATFIAKNGNKKSKATSQNMMFSFCPFCGVSLKAEENATAEAEVPA